jgi:nicotinate-nucleotide adenylyltransferase
MATVAVYGGSFDPPHVGHAMVASWLTWTRQADVVWLLPTFQHAFGKEMSPWPLRLAWTRALADLVGADVTTIEADLPVPSYTIDTLDALARRHPEHRFRLVIGSDNLEVKDKWRQWDRIDAEYRPIVVGRTGYTVPDGAVAFPEVSSTEIRRRLRAGLDVSAWVPRAVLDLVPPGAYGAVD